MGLRSIYHLQRSLVPHVGWEGESPLCHPTYSTYERPSVFSAGRRLCDSARYLKTVEVIAMAP